MRFGAVFLVIIAVGTLAGCRSDSAKQLATAPMPRRDVLHLEGGRAFPAPPGFIERSRELVVGKLEADGTCSVTAPALKPGNNAVITVETASGCKRIFAQGSMDVSKWKQDTAKSANSASPVQGIQTILGLRTATYRARFAHWLDEILWLQNSLTWSFGSGKSWGGSQSITSGFAPPIYSATPVYSLLYNVDSTSYLSRSTISASFVADDLSAECAPGTYIYSINLDIDGYENGGDVATVSSRGEVNCSSYYLFSYFKIS